MLQNQPLVAAFIAWAIAQTLKIFTEFPRNRRVDFRMWASSGGMPSSHSALVTGLATAIGIQDGLGSTTFALAFIFGAVVMYDATGVRLAAGHQARILNQIVAELFAGHPISERKLKELIGHTPIQVVMGALLGFSIGIIWMARYR